MTFTEFMKIDLSMGYLVVVCILYTIILIVQSVRHARKLYKLEDKIAAREEKLYFESGNGW